MSDVVHFYKQNQLILQIEMTMNAGIIKRIHFGISEEIIAWRPLIKLITTVVVTAYGLPLSLILSKAVTAAVVNVMLLQ